MGHIVDDENLRGRPHVFRDREHAGAIMAELLSDLSGTDTVVLAIPAGGAPVAARIARALRLPLDVAVVSKVTLPWNSEAGYGAVAFDGTARLNDQLLSRLDLSADQIEHGVAKTRRKVEQRVERLRGGRPPLALADKTVVLVDDGLASGFTMRVAVEAVRSAGARRVVVAAPTGHERAVQGLSEMADEVRCANVRGGPSFAVADAYERWRDVTVAEAREALDVERIDGAL
ncbi:MAG: phosphoribosyltransferase [Polyangiales bacterium]